MSVKSAIGQRVRMLLLNNYERLERHGIHVSPVHFYHPIPDSVELKDEIWQRRTQLVGIDLNEDAQIAMVKRFAEAYRKEYETFPRDATPIPHQYYLDNLAFNAVDAEILYCMIREHKPARMIEMPVFFSACLPGGREPGLLPWRASFFAIEKRVVTICSSPRNRTVCLISLYSSLGQGSNTLSGNVGRAQSIDLFSVCGGPAQNVAATDVVNRGTIQLDAVCGDAPDSGRRSLRRLEQRFR